MSNFHTFILPVPKSVKILEELIWCRFYNILNLILNKNAELLIPIFILKEKAVKLQAPVRKKGKSLSIKTNILILLINVHDLCIPLACKK